MNSPKRAAWDLRLHSMCTRHHKESQFPVHVNETQTSVASSKALLWGRCRSLPTGLPWQAVSSRAFDPGVTSLELKPEHISLVLPSSCVNHTLKSGGVLVLSTLSTCCMASSNRRKLYCARPLFHSGYLQPAARSQRPTVLLQSFPWSLMWPVIVAAGRWRGRLIGCWTWRPASSHSS